MPRRPEELTEQDPLKGDPYAEDFYREDEAYHRLLPELMSKYAGKFVAIREGKVVDWDDDGAELSTRVHEKDRNRFVLIREVVPADEDRTEELPSPEAQER